MNMQLSSHTLHLDRAKRTCLSWSPPLHQNTLFALKRIVCAVGAMKKKAVCFVKDASTSMYLSDVTDIIIISAMLVVHMRGQIVR